MKILIFKLKINMELKRQLKQGLIKPEFGNIEHLNALAQLEEEKLYKLSKVYRHEIPCKRCEGTGTIACPDCDGGDLEDYEYKCIHCGASDDVPMTVFEIKEDNLFCKHCGKKLSKNFKVIS